MRSIRELTEITNTLDLFLIMLVKVSLVSRYTEGQITARQLDKIAFRYVKSHE